MRNSILMHSCVDIYAHSARILHLEFNYSISGRIDLQNVSYLARGVAPVADRGRKDCSPGKNTHRCRRLPPMRFAVAR